ncbi:MAG: mechanosensitive ion channel family protein [Clostridia bacterium]|nr:mechanosensitive ion channel family protein [Clostridia bacterium]
MKKRIIKIVILAVVLAVLISVGFFSETFTEIGEILDGAHFNPASVLHLLIMICVVIVIKDLIVFVLSLIKTKSHRINTVLTIAASALHYIAAIIMVCWGLTILGVDVTTIVASVGILALIIGFGAESLIGDIVTGFFMLFENQYNVGDYVEVNGFRGRVVNIGIRTTSLEDTGGNIKIVNNSNMTDIINRSNRASKSVSVVGIPYETDIEELEKKLPALMEEIFEKHRDIMIDCPVYLGVESLDDSAVMLKFVVNVNDKNIYTGNRILNHDIWIGLRKLGIEVPFPQIDVHSK